MAPKSSEKPIFRDLVVSMACQLGGQWTDTNISRWVNQRSGVFITEMNNSVTHLICSPEEFKKRGPRVKQALKRGAACHIVSVDWLEDSINKKRRLKEKPYLLTTALKQERAKIRREVKEAKGLEQAERFVNSNLYHTYTDATYFRYEITLTRDDAEEEIKGQRYTLYLFESNARPHLYLFAAKLYKKHRDPQPNFFRPSQTPQSFSTEFDRFKSFFRKKTGIEWDERLIKARTADKGHFSYSPPVSEPTKGHWNSGTNPILITRNLEVC
ncbi:hypothetical protein QBC33DRAFT_347514 [Phialemonium atrogriseum]|uniref:BRCT domain-containing protein n=1 Tax=Phialemonium atrogriseum TaxID=1093897 RepID=A0AAJ0C3E7_9PEZI|nr:uncharacterized protein QBC33DRAFT_347514 [Phialemonium atrogriseum]KAK1769225.1 hypothetical protein QBC33DRAFT_347514 [Phialemonium atrogriseum]